jgi:sugar fermentation stimulation protein A
MPWRVGDDKTMCGSDGLSLAPNACSGQRERVQFDPLLTPGTLVRRYKRFLADVLLDDGREVIAHCPNPGSMKTCAEPGWRVWLSPAMNPARKLRWTWEIVIAEPGGVAVLVNTARPNRIVYDAIVADQVPELSGYSSIKTEVRYGEKSRVDLLLSDPNSERADCYVEVKSVTLSVGPHQVGFPDSVTKRGLKHMVELTRMVEAGHRAVVFFLVSRMDAEQMRPADEFDPAYGAALRAAVDAGVEAIAYRADIRVDGLGMGSRLPLTL